MNAQIITRYMSDEGEEDAEEEADDNEAAAEVPVVVEEGQGAR